jgi:hypothetical protein
MQTRVPWWLRLYLLIAAAQALVYGASGFLMPLRGLPGLRIALFLSAVSARFTGTLYLTLALSLILAAFVQSARDTRIFVIGLAVTVGMTLSVTLLHWREFSLESLRYLWVVTYGAHLLIALCVWLWLNRHVEPLPPPRTAPSLFQIEGLLLGSIGLLLLFLPGYAILLWPWKIVAVEAGFYACFFIALATVAALAAREPRSPDGRSFSITSLGFAVFVLIASIQDFDRFSSGASTWIWYAVLGLAVIAFTRDLFHPSPNSETRAPSSGQNDRSARAPRDPRPAPRR